MELESTDKIAMVYETLNKTDHFANNCRHFGF